MLSNLPPGTLVLVGGLLVAFMRGRLRQLWVVLIPVASLLHLLFCHQDGHLVTTEFFGQQLTPIRVDRLSLIWGYVFHIAAILASIYAWHVRDRLQDFAAMLYVGASIGAVFAGDLLTLFVYWEITAITSVFLVFANQSGEYAKQTMACGMRYVTMHVGSGVLVLSGALLILQERGTLAFGGINEVGMFHDLASWGSFWLLLGFGIKAAFPLLHCWLPDAYPKSTITGTVFLSAFTTKMAIYALARGFAGTEVLLTIGALMALFPLAHALLADDMRQSLSHILNNQLGFMVAGIGVGTDMAINGVAAQAFAHVIYKGLLFMSIGAVIQQVGSARQSKLGGLAKQMPWTCVCCLVGAFSVFPLNCGFVTKSLVLSSVAEHHHDFVWLALVAGAVGAFLVAGLKVPYFTFFATASNDTASNRAVEPAPTHMRIAMMVSAGICLLIGCVPGLLYRQLPFACDYHPYTLSHVGQQLQLLSFTFLAFVLLLRFGFYPQPITGQLLDVDWVYRGPLSQVFAHGGQFIAKHDPLAKLVSTVAKSSSWFSHQSSEAGLLGRTISTNTMAVMAVLLLAVYLLIYF